MTEPMIEDEDDFYSTEPQQPAPVATAGAALSHDNSPTTKESSELPSAAAAAAAAVAADVSKPYAPLDESGPNRQTDATEVSEHPDSAAHSTAARESSSAALPSNGAEPSPLAQLHVSSTSEIGGPTMQAVRQLNATAPDEAEAVLATIPTAPAEGAIDGNAGAPEFEADSSPYESSSEDSSSDDSSDDDSSDEDYALLDPREQARILMADAGSDDEGGKKEGGGRGPRTQNENVDEIVEMPSLDITADMKIEELGSVQVIIDNVALIKAKISGEYQVLESSSVLCLEDRKLIGVVAETIGRVEQPMYVVRFTNPTTLKDLGLEVGKTIYYLPSHSHFLFTKALQVKGSDASNLHDEEVADNEIEFSDDEAEAAHKASLKKQRQAKKDARSGGSTAPGKSSARPSFAARQPGSEASEGPSVLSYDDAPQTDDLYTPLARPSFLMQAGATDQRSNGNHPARGGQRGRGRGRGGHQSSRGRGRGHAPTNSHNDASQNFGAAQQPFVAPMPIQISHATPQHQQHQQQPNFGQNMQTAFAPYLPQPQPSSTFQYPYPALQAHAHQQQSVNLSTIPQFLPAGQPFPGSNHADPGNSFRGASFPDHFQHQQYSQSADQSNRQGHPAYYDPNSQNYPR